MNPWTDAERQFVIQAKTRNPNIKYPQISEMLSTEGYPYRNRHEVRGIWRRHQESLEGASDAINLEAMPEVGEEHKNALEDMHRLRDRALRETAKWHKHIGNPAKDANIKVVSLSDLHLPFYHEDVVNEVIAKHADADVLVLNGDFLEMYSVSSWSKNKSIMLRHEYEIGSRMLQLIASKFKKVLVTRGNHEDRLQRYFSNKIDPSVSFMTHPDILERMTSGYDFGPDGTLQKMHDFSNVHYSPGPTSWYVQVGQCIFAHPSGGSVVPMRTVIKTADWFASRGREFEAVCIGHTHQMGQIIHNKRMLIEQGCACVPLEYETGSRMAYRPQSFGYAVIYMDKDGHIDFDRSAPVYCGTGHIVEKGHPLEHLD